MKENIKEEQKYYEKSFEITLKKNFSIINNNKIDKENNDINFNIKTVKNLKKKKIKKKKFDFYKDEKLLIKLIRQKLNKNKNE